MKYKGFVIDKCYGGVGIWFDEDNWEECRPFQVFVTIPMAKEFIDEFTRAKS